MHKQQCLHDTQASTEIQKLKNQTFEVYKKLEEHDKSTKDALSSVENQINKLMEYMIELGDNTKKQITTNRWLVIISSLIIIVLLVCIINML